MTAGSGVRARAGMVAGLLALGAATVGIAGPARAAADAVVIGDSLGVGVSMASGLTRLARNSVAIRGGAILGQLRQANPGSVVFMSLGTNDAVGRIDGLDADIARIIAAANGVKLVWIGPPCVLKSWDTNAEKLDAILKARTAGTGVTYVSMRDPAMCAASARAKDGVHFTMTGYGMMWSKARTVVGYEGGNPTTKVASAGTSRRSGKRRTARRRKPAVTVASETRAAPPEAAAPERRARTRRPATADAER